MQANSDVLTALTAECCWAVMCGFPPALIFSLIRNTFYFGHFTFSGRRLCTLVFVSVFRKHRANTRRDECAQRTPLQGEKSCLLSLASAVKAPVLWLVVDVGLLYIWVDTLRVATSLQVGHYGKKQQQTPQTPLPTFSFPTFQPWFVFSFALKQN